MVTLPSGRWRRYFFTNSTVLSSFSADNVVADKIADLAGAAGSALITVAIAPVDGKLDAFRHDGLAENGAGTVILCTELLFGQLKSLGLGYRARYVSNIARLVLEGEICLDYLHTADYTEARTYLKSIDGIGERIASLICLYGLGMKEAFPADANFKKIVASKYDGRFPVELYGTNRGVAWLYVTTADRMERGRGK